MIKVNFYFLRYISSVMFAFIVIPLQADQKTRAPAIEVLVSPAVGDERNTPEDRLKQELLVKVSDEDLEIQAREQASLGKILTGSNSEAEQALVNELSKKLDEAIFLNDPRKVAAVVYEISKQNNEAFQEQRDLAVTALSGNVNEKSASEDISKATDADISLYARKKAKAGEALLPAYIFNSTALERAKKLSDDYILAEDLVSKAQAFAVLAQYNDKTAKLWKSDAVTKEVNDKLDNLQRNFYVSGSDISSTELQNLAQKAGEVGYVILYDQNSDYFEISHKAGDLQRNYQAAIIMQEPEHIKALKAKITDFNYQSLTERFNPAKNLR